MLTWLDGSINFANNIGIEDINLDSLINRIKDSNIEEIIIAMNQTTSGELTTRYIKKLLENSNIKISRIANGVPVGADISYSDEFTLSTALKQRVIF